MAQSLSHIYIHLVFHTYTKGLLIKGTDAEELYAYWGGTLKELGCQPIAINGMPDHVHLLFDLSRSITLSDVVKHLKQSGHRFLETKGAFYTGFAWQKGYAAFSVSAGLKDKVEQYIRHQKAHHTDLDARAEYIRLLELAGIEYNEEYLWG